LGNLKADSEFEDDMVRRSLLGLITSQQMRPGGTDVGWEYTQEVNKCKLPESNEQVYVSESEKI
jgi:hypothetical protein